MAPVITISEPKGPFELSVGGHTIGTAQARELVEGDYDPVLYFDPAMIDMSQFEPSTHRTHCPFKGDASYYDLVIDGKRHENVAWTYSDPLKSVEAIKDHLGFYPVVSVSPI